MKRSQRGLTTTEFAIIGPVALVVLFGCIEIGRAMFVWNTIAEATRRGARLATVVNPVTGATTITNAVTTFGNAAEVKTANVVITYSDATGATVPNTDTTMQFVTVGITGVTHSLLIPFVGQNIPVPAFSTTLPVESLGNTS